MNTTKQTKLLETELNERSKQLNPNNIEYWKSRNNKKRPKDWTNQIKIQTLKKKKMTKKMTSAAAARIQSATAKSTGGKVSKGTFAARAQSVSAKSATKKGN